MTLANWVRATSATTGTGNLTLSAVTGYVTPASAFGNGVRFRYVLLDDSDGTPRESGIGYLSSGALVRELVQATYSGGTYTEATSNSSMSATSLSGTTRVICSPMHIDLAQIPVAGITSGTQADDIFAPFNFESPATGSIALSSSSRSFYIPVLLCWTHVVDAFCIRVTATVGSSDFGLYDVLPNGMPGDLLIGWENQSVTANTTMAYTFSSRTHGKWAAANRIIPPGWYWAHINSAAAMTFGRVFSLAQRSPLPSVGLDTGTRRTCLVINRTQGTLADPAPTSGLSLTTVTGSTDVITVPAFGFRRA